MIRLTCTMTGHSIWLRPEMILALVPLPADDEYGNRTRIDVDSDLECVVVNEHPDEIAFLLGLLVVIV